MGKGRKFVGKGRKFPVWNFACRMNARFLIFWFSGLNGEFLIIQVQGSELFIQANALFIQGKELFIYKEMSCSYKELGYS